MYVIRSCFLRGGSHVEKSEIRHMFEFCYKLRNIAINSLTIPTITEIFRSLPKFSDHYRNFPTVAEISDDYRNFPTIDEIFRWLSKVSNKLTKKWLSLDFSYKWLFKESEISRQKLKFPELRVWSLQRSPESWNDPISLLMAFLNFFYTLLYRPFDLEHKISPL